MVALVAASLTRRRTIDCHTLLLSDGVSQRLLVAARIPPTLARGASGNADTCHPTWQFSLPSVNVTGGVLWCLDTRALSGEDGSIGMVGLGGLLALRSSQRLIVRAEAASPKVSIAKSKQSLQITRQRTRSPSLL